MASIQYTGNYAYSERVLTSTFRYKKEIGLSKKYRKETKSESEREKEREKER